MYYLNIKSFASCQYYIFKKWKTFFPHQYFFLENIRQPRNNIFRNKNYFFFLSKTKIGGNFYLYFCMINDPSVLEYFSFLFFFSFYWMAKKYVIIFCKIFVFVYIVWTWFLEFLHAWFDPGDLTRGIWLGCFPFSSNAVFFFMHYAICSAVSFFLFRNG